VGSRRAAATRGGGARRRGAGRGIDEAHACYIGDYCACVCLPRSSVRTYVFVGSFPFLSVAHFHVFVRSSFLICAYLFICQSA
jgi:hypothetical protein